MKVLIVGAGLSGLKVAHALRSAGVDTTVITSRSSDELRYGRPQITQLTLPHGLAAETEYNLSLWTGSAPKFDRVALTVDAGGGQAVGFTGALPGPGLAVDPRVKLADWLEMFEDLGGKVSIQGVTVSDLDHFTRMYDAVLLAVGDGELGQILDEDRSTTGSGRDRRRTVAQAYLGMADAPDDEVRVHSCAGGEMFLVPVQTREGWALSVMLVARPDSALDVRSYAGTGSIRRGEGVWPLMVHAMRQAQIPGWEVLSQGELLDSNSTLIKAVRPTIRRPVHTFGHGGSLVGVGDTVMTVPPQCGQGWEASARSAMVYTDLILEHARAGGAFDTAFLDRLFPAYMDQGGGRDIDVFERYVDRFWEGTSTPAEQGLFARACQDQATADAYAAGFADPARLVAMLNQPTG